jgi:DNA-directed RNA polymerase specialized sigma24 family protein/protocatechuate 3,4-dioxygenase beta subunit
MIQGAKTGTLGQVRVLWESGATGPQADAQLLSRFLDGSGEVAEAAFAALVERHGPAVRRVCRDVLGDPHEAQDAAQAAFLVLARRAAAIRRPDSLGPWLHGVALRVARRSRAVAARRREVERRGAVAGRSAAVEGPPPLPCPELHEELARLPEKYRAPIVLCYLEGRTQEQAADALGWPLGTVQTRLHRGRHQLRDRLVRRGVAPAALASLGVTAEASSLAAALPTGWAEATAHAAVRFAGRGAAVPAATARLAEETLSTLAAGRLRQVAFALLATGLVASALVAAALAAGGRRDDETPPPDQPPSRANSETVTSRPDESNPVAPAAGDDVEGEPSTSVLHGFVVGEDGRPVSGASVRLSTWRWRPQSVKTAEHGSFTMRLDRALSPRFQGSAWFHASADEGRLQGVSRVKGPTNFIERGDKEQVDAEVQLLFRTDRDVATLVARIQKAEQQLARALRLMRTEQGRLDPHNHRLTADARRLTDEVKRLKGDYQSRRTEMYPALRERVLRGLGPVRIVVKPARTITATVVDARDEPVAGANVMAVGSYFDSATHSTDDQGRARLLVPTEAPVEMVIALKAGEGFDYFENYKNWPAAPGEMTVPPAEVRLRLNGAKTVPVQVVDGTGKPVTGVEMIPWYLQKPGKVREVNFSTFASRLARATSGPDGVASFTWLPADAQAVPFLVASEGYFCEDQPNYNPADGRVDVTARVVREVPVSGRVVGPDGKPAVGIAIVAEGYADGPNPAHASALTDAEGRYRLMLPPGVHAMVAVEDERWAAPSRTGLLVPEGRPVEGVDFTLARGTVFRGRVTTPDGRPASGEWIAFRELGRGIPTAKGRLAYHHGRESLTRNAITDHDGRYEIRVGPGRFVVMGPRDNRVSDDKIVEVADEETIERDFALPPEKTKSPLNGTVKTPEGKPAAGVLMQALPIGDDPGLSRFGATTDSEGRFRGERYLEPVLMYARTVDGAQAGAGQVEPDREEVELHLTPSAVARGRVVDAEGKPVAGARVFLGWGLAPPEDKINYGPMSARTLTDAEGRYTFEGLPVGALANVTVIQEDFRVQSSRFDVKQAGEVAVEDITLSAPPSREL